MVIFDERNKELFVDEPFRCIAFGSMFFDVFNITYSPGASSWEIELRANEYIKDFTFSQLLFVDDVILKD